MTPKVHHKQISAENQETVRDLLQEKLKLAIRYTLIEALEEEVQAYIQAARYERTGQRQDHLNGTYVRNLGTAMGELEELPVPRTRKGFRTQLFERYKRRQAELDDSICDMFVYGVSTEKVGQVLETLSGSHPSPATVSRVFHTLEAEFEEWKKRPLQSHYLYLIADGTYFSVIYDGQGAKMPILAVIGIDETGKRQRCVRHKMENVLGYVPKERKPRPKTNIGTRASISSQKRTPVCFAPCCRVSSLSAASPTHSCAANTFLINPPVESLACSNACVCMA